MTGIGYMYDAAGNRVAKGNVHEVQAGGVYQMTCDVTSNGFNQISGYVVGPSGEQLTEVGADNRWLHTNVWAGGKLIATYSMFDTGVQFHIDDPLGTRRAQANSAGALDAVYPSLPFGDGLAYGGTANDPTENHFTGKERDTESGNDYFGARYYASSMGRFMSPDWSAKQDPVPYAKLDSPQTLNLYSYVGNNPLSNIDADGHFASPWHFLITFVAAIATGHDLFDSVKLSGQVVAADFRPGTQGLDSIAANEHATAGEVMTPNGPRLQDTAEAIEGTRETIRADLNKGDVAGAVHDGEDMPASGHNDKPWEGFGLNMATVKHEIGDWLPSPGALWKSLKNAISIFNAADSQPKDLQVPQATPAPQPNQDQ